MNAAAIERLIATISWGCIPVTVSTQDEGYISLLLRNPTPKEQAKAARIYSIENQRAAIIGLNSEIEVLANMIEMGQWSLEKEQEIEGIQKDIMTIRRGLLDLIFNTKKLEKARSLLRRAENALITRLENRHALLGNSAESHSEIAQQRYMIGKITETDDGERFWRTDQAFNECQDNALIVQLCEYFFHKSRIPISNIRELARSQQWRSYWEIAKATNDLFDSPVSSWSLNQRELAYWSTIYDSVYEAFERPSKDIIADDDLLDSWFIRQGEKIDSKTNNSVVPKSNKPGRNEEFIMSDEEGAKRIYQMNDQSARIQIKARQKLLAKHGSVKEQDMPDSQLEMREQLSKMTRQKVKSINTK